MRRNVLHNSLAPIILGTIDKIASEHIFINGVKYTIARGKVIEIRKIGQKPITDIKELFSFTLSCLK